MITIDQLLESVDLDFEPRWVTKDEDGTVCIWPLKPERTKIWWYVSCEYGVYNSLKLSEFDGKDWTECIYEVPQQGRFIDLIQQVLLTQYMTATQKNSKNFFVWKLFVN